MQTLTTILPSTPATNAFLPQQGYGNLVGQYLEITNEVIESALEEYMEVSAILVNLIVPSGLILRGDDILRHFFSGFQLIADNEADIAYKACNKPWMNLSYQCRVKYVCSRNSYLNGDVASYSMMLIFNKRVFPLSNDNQSDEVLNKVHAAWAAALGESVGNTVIPPVFVQKHAQFKYIINNPVDGDVNREQFNQLFHDAAYLSCLNGKNYNDYSAPFNHSLF